MSRSDLRKWLHGLAETHPQNSKEDNAAGAAADAEGMSAAAVSAYMALCLCVRACDQFLVLLMAGIGGSHRPLKSGVPAAPGRPPAPGQGLPHCCPEGQPGSSQ